MTVVRLLLVLVTAVVAWVVLSFVALAVRSNVFGFEVADLDQALAWGKDLLGLAGILGGFLGVSKAVKDGDGLGIASAPAEGGTLGFLGGATLLEVGGTAVPVALAALVVAGGTVRIIESMRGGGTPDSVR